jgi:hypothetical protein
MKPYPLLNETSRYEDCVLGRLSELFCFVLSCVEMDEVLQLTLPVHVEQDSKVVKEDGAMFCHVGFRNSNQRRNRTTATIGLQLK